MLCLSNKAWRGVVYMANIPRLKAVLTNNAMRSAWIQQIVVVLYIGHIPQTPKVPYCYYELVTIVIRALKINVLSYPWYTVWYTTAVNQSAFSARTTQFIIWINKPMPIHIHPITEMCKGSLNIMAHRLSAAHHGWHHAYTPLPMKHS